MVAELIAKPRSGRTGLQALEVNIATYLELQQRLDTGEKLPFNERQLQLAFARWLVASGQGRHGEAKSPEKMRDVALYLVEKHRKVLANARDKSPAAKKEYLAENGLVAIAARDRPETIRDAGPGEAARTERGIDGAQRAIGIAADLFEIAEMSTNPTMTVISVLAADALAGGLNNAAQRGARIITDTLDKHANSDAAKDVCIQGLHRLLGTETDAAPAAELQAIQQDHVANGDDRIAVELQEVYDPSQAGRLQGALDHRRETAALQQTIDRKPAAELARTAFLANSIDATTRPLRQAQAEQLKSTGVQQALLAHPHLIKGLNAPAPKPPSWATDALQKKGETA